MRRVLLLVVGFGAGGLLLLVLCISVAAQCSVSNELPSILPVDVEGTSLKAVELSVYEGPFWEDGIAEHAVDIAALVVENKGGCYISEGAVVLDWGEDRMVFELSWIPPGGKVLVLEKGRKAFCVLEQMRCYGWSSEIYPEQTGVVVVQESGGAELSFVNRTSSVIPEATVMFKHYDSQRDMYIGGITYSITAQALQPGEIRAVTPWRYASGYSRTICVLTNFE